MAWGSPTTARAGWRPAAPKLKTEGMHILQTDLFGQPTLEQKKSKRSESFPDKRNNKDQIRREKAQKSGGSLRKIKGDVQKLGVSKGEPESSHHGQIKRKKLI